MRRQDRISADAHVCHGTACLKGTRVLVFVILDGLVAGESPETIANAYRLTTNDARAALLYPAALSKERIVPLQPGAAAGARGKR